MNTVHHKVKGRSYTYDSPEQAEERALAAADASDGKLKATAGEDGDWEITATPQRGDGKKGEV